MYGHWIESHGFEMLAFAWIFSGAMSVMPPLSSTAGWWTKWLHDILQLFGANLGNLVKHTPAGAQLETLVSSQKKTAPDGSSDETKTAATSATQV
jgi:hypothetical protein